MANRPRPFLGLMAGIAAGLVASAAMAAFQNQAQKLLPEGEDDPATGESAPEPDREPAGQLVHYVAGAVIGGIYGVITEYKPEASAGFGGAYGIATAALLDEAMPGAVPDPAEIPLSTHAYGAASHLLYGWVLEGMRALIAGRR